MKVPLNHIFLFFFQGPSFVKSCLAKMVQLWSSVFPDGPDIDAEKGRGSLKTWQRTMENRAGALCCEFYYSMEAGFISISILSVSSGFRTIY